MTHTEIAYHTYIDSALQCCISLMKADDSGESVSVHLWRLASVEALNVEGFVAVNRRRIGAISSSA